MLVASNPYFQNHTRHSKGKWDCHELCHGAMGGAGGERNHSATGKYQRKVGWKNLVRLFVTPK